MLPPGAFWKLLSRVNDRLQKAHLPLFQTPAALRIYRKQMRLREKQRRSTATVAAKRPRPDSARQLSLQLMRRMLGKAASKAMPLHVCALSVVCYMLRRCLLAMGILCLGCSNKVQLAKGRAPEPVACLLYSVVLFEA